MEIIQKEPIFSKQGKASRQANTNLLSSPRKFPKPKPIQPTPITNIKSLIQELQKQNQADLQAKQAKIKPSPSFKAVSRQQYQFAFRNKTESPKVGNYSPRDQVISPRNTIGPKMVLHTSVPKQKTVLLAKCVDHQLNCSFPRKKTEKPFKFSQRLNRTIKTTAQYDQLARLKQIKWSPIAEKKPSKLISPLKFNLQKNRHPFVKNTDGANEKRFDFVFPTSLILSNNKKPSVTDVEKVSKRGELFPLGMPLGSYDRNQEATLPKLTRLVTSFEKVQGRRGLSLDHIAKNPVSPDLNKLDRAINLQSKFRGPVKIPLMEQQSSRDDIMYRTLEMYNLNVPERQDSMSPPKYMGDSMSEFISKVRMTATLNSFSNSIK